MQKDTADRQPLTQVATWVIGEFGDLLLANTEAPLRVSKHFRSASDTFCVVNLVRVEISVTRFFDTIFYVFATKFRKISQKLA